MEKVDMVLEVLSELGIKLEEEEKSIISEQLHSNIEDTIEPGPRRY